jgi:hypothetical protein
MATLANALPQNSSVAVIVPSKPTPTILTYAQLVEHTYAFQRKLAALGIEKGHAVSIALGNSLEFIVSRTGFAICCQDWIIDKTPCAGFISGYIMAKRVRISSSWSSIENFR